MFFFIFCDELGIEYFEFIMIERLCDNESYFFVMFKWYIKYLNIDYNSKFCDILLNFQ